jgi:Ni/Fe-hydrogenase 1 B-type cytochrome subunit
MSPTTATTAAAGMRPFEATVHTYVWELPVRISHWVIVFAILVLSVTGFYIGYPFITVRGAAGQSFVMGWMKVVHGYAGYAFAAALVMRFVWMLTGNKYSHWDKFFRLNRVRRKGLINTAAFYTFLRDKPPAYVGHNPAASSAYAMVYGLCGVMVLTGLILRGASTETSVIAFFGSWAELVGGLPTVRWIHHIVMWLLLGFAVHHVYSAILVAMVEQEGTIESIVTGYKWVPRHDLEPGPYRWDNKGEVDE